MIPRCYYCGESEVDPEPCEDCGLHLCASCGLVGGECRACDDGLVVSPAESDCSSDHSSDESPVADEE